MTESGSFEIAVVRLLQRTAEIVRFVIKVTLSILYLLTILTTIKWKCVRHDAVHQSAKLSPMLKRGSPTSLRLTIYTTRTNLRTLSYVRILEVDGKPLFIVFSLLSTLMVTDRSQSTGANTARPTSETPNLKNRTTRRLRNIRAISSDSYEIYIEAMSETNERSKEQRMK